MGRSVSVTLNMVDQVSQKLDAVCNSAERAFNKMTAFYDRMDQVFERATSRAERVGTSIQAAAESVSSYAEQGNRASRIMEEQADSSSRASRAIEEQAGAMDMAAQAFEGQTESVNAAVQALEEHAASTDAAIQALEGQSESVDRAVRALEEQAEMADEVTRSMEENSEAVRQNSERTREGSERSREYQEQTEETTRSVMDLGDALAAAGIAVALSKIADAYNKCDEVADKFESAMAKVGTIADTQSVSLNSIQAEIQALSKETGVSVADLAESTYSAISASVDTADAVAFVAQANSLAVGGFTQTSTAVDILTTAINAYGLEAGQTSNIADMLIQTQNLGKTSVDELAGSMGKVIPTANSLGVQLDVLCGSYAVMTANGIATAETTTYLNSMLNELGKNGTSAANALKEGTEHIRAGGLTMAEAMESGMSLTDVLAVLDEQARESGTSISNMFGSAEAGKAANVLWGNAQKVDRAIAQMGSSAGAAETAFRKMSDTGEYVDMKWQNSLENLKISIGNAQPSLDGLMEKGTEIVNMLSDFVDGHPEVVGAVEGMAVALGAFTVVMGAHAAATLIAEKAAMALTAAMDTNPIFLAAAALAAAAAGVAVFVNSMGKAEEAQEKLTGTSLKMSNEIKRQEDAVAALKDEYGAYNDRTLEAQARLNELRAEYDETKTTLEDFEAQVRRTIDAVDESIAAYNENSAKLEDRSSYAMSLVAELKMLQSQSELTAFQQQYEKQVVAQLNEIYPELGLSYDDVSRKLGKSTDYLKKYCEQENERFKLEMNAKQSVEYLERENELKEKLDTATQNLNDSTSEYNRLMEEFANAANSNEWSGATANLSEYQEGIAQAELSMESAQASVDELTAEMNVLHAAMGALGAVSELTAAGIDGIGDASGSLIDTTADLRVAMEDIFTNVREQAEELAAAYQDAYNAAASAVDSSFGMFEKIEQKSKISTKSMIEAWDSQTKYLLEYSDNIQKAKEYGIDASLVENLADGSQESAAALDTIISKIENLGATTDTAKGFIDDMNDSFRIREDAKQTLEASMVDVNVSLQRKLEELKAIMETGVDGLDLSGEAASAAQDTMAAYIARIQDMQSSAFDAAASVASAVEAALAGTKVTAYNAAYQSAMYTGKGLINGVESMHPAVTEKYKWMAKKVHDVVDDEWKIKSPSRKFKESAEYTMEGIIEGVEGRQSDVLDMYEGIAKTSVERYQEKIMNIATVTDEYLGLVAEKYGRYSDESAKAFDFVVGRLEDLSKAYEDNYESAYQSISGKLGLFNDVEIGTSKSIDEMMDSLKKQSDYMAEYGAYMYNAMELGVDEGILEKLSDGSTESAAILKEIVTNGANRIDELNANFARVEEGKKTFSVVMAELETYYGSKLDGMVSELEQAVNDMDQYGAAFQSAEDTCQGIIDGVESKWGAVVQKYADLSNAAVMAFAPLGSIPAAPVIGHAGGTTYGEDVYLAGENGPELIVGRRGSEVFPASETARILSAVMADRDSDIDLAPQEIINTIIHENNSSSTNTENRNVTLTINGKGTFGGAGQGVSQKDVVEYIRNELEGALMDIISREMYEEGAAAYEF